MTTAASPALISETFVSLQGEGILAGVPSWFCRFSGCNLRCRWCDTPYASWSPEGTSRGVGALADEAAASGVRHAVLTGGEPMIFPQLGPLSGELRARGVHVTIETAGTVDRDDISFDLLSLSPKLANSTPAGDPRDPSGAWAARHESRRIDRGVLRALVERAREPGRAVQAKFVVARPADLPEIEELVGSIGTLRPDEVLLMPEGTSVPRPGDVSWVVSACVERGWRYCHRLHIELFGDTRGT